MLHADGARSSGDVGVERARQRGEGHADAGPRFRVHRRDRREWAQGDVHLPRPAQRRDRLRRQSSAHHTRRYVSVRAPFQDHGRPLKRREVVHRVRRPGGRAALVRRGELPDHPELHDRQGSADRAGNPRSGEAIQSQQRPGARSRRDRHGPAADGRRQSLPLLPLRHARGRDRRRRLLARANRKAGHGHQPRRTARPSAHGLPGDIRNLLRRPQQQDHRRGR